MNFKHLTIIQKIYGGIGLLLVLCVAVGGIGYYGLSKSTAGAGAFFKKDVPYLRATHELKIEALMHRRYEKDFFLNIGKADKQKKYLTKFESSSKILLAKLSQLSALVETSTPNRETILAGIASAKANYQGYHDGFLNLSNTVLGEANITPQEANKRMKPFKAKIYAFEKDIDQLLGDGVGAVEERKNSITAQNAAAGTQLLLIIGVSVICAAAFGFFLSRNIKRSLSDVSTSLDEASLQVASASGQVSSASQSMASGSSEQAAAIEEMSSSLEETAAMARQNAGNADQANQLMRNANDVVGNASREMKELTTSMAAISKASEETQKIVKTIDEIAFQTNLLALNAAVEAARAGEAGAGFAVVADEVRNLAIRAAEAAKNTSDLIEDTSGRIQGGAGLVETTNKAFNEISAATVKVSDLVGEIAAASNEQAQGVEQINRAITEMDKVVQNNAATAEESASASEEMNAQAEEMKAFVEHLAAMVGLRREAGTLSESSKEPGPLSTSGSLTGAATVSPAPARPLASEETFGDF